ncbi:hypothetical protein PICMEDRAFT_74025 [Pichia membranifaciens NRRL Y-2026]|uniref:Uncharacterized protein n=1 Tax=Pichia membranifaciens NRRL Y-2026 TaxID=763406 RepID=A0A1E3NGK8_9ASCO|nr:hypothetical protein PICMEDRAFT_74025 [Pichia membranifaciens NRRL Y-2026]ODQ45254.1 hypothetical protein PICMEDRAFT_74025 [Pichia membranifaciens NRRL Y-2026]
MAINTMPSYNQTPLYAPNVHVQAAKLPGYAVPTKAHEYAEYTPAFVQIPWQAQHAQQQAQRSHTPHYTPAEFHQSTHPVQQQQLFQNYLLNSTRASPVPAVPAAYIQHTHSLSHSHSPISAYSSSANSSFSSTATTPPLCSTTVFPIRKPAFQPLPPSSKPEELDRRQLQLKLKLKDPFVAPFPSRSSSAISTPVSAPSSACSATFSAGSLAGSAGIGKIVKPKNRSGLQKQTGSAKQFKRPTSASASSLVPAPTPTPSSAHAPLSQSAANKQSEISPDMYVPADPSLDISGFTEEDIIILKNLLSFAEIHKWKYISNKLSKTRSKKLNAEYCITKFHAMYGLPFSPKNSLLHSNYFLKIDKERKPEEESFEGILGSSIPYIVSKDGWNLIDA